MVYCKWSEGNVLNSVTYILNGSFQDGSVTISNPADTLKGNEFGKTISSKWSMGITDPDLTLSKAIALGRAVESSRTQLKEIKEEVTVDKLSSHKETSSNKNTEHKFVKKNHKLFKACGKCASKHEYGVGLLKNKQSILIKEDAIPQVYTARILPLAMREPVREELEKMNYYTKYPEVFELRSTKAEMVIEKLKEVFARCGVPEIYPTIWTKSIIHPIFKSGDKDNPSNYRGIALIIRNAYGSQQKFRSGMVLKKIEDSLE
ncbi:hypothetical protein LAZ67_9002362 [Cordylochernes scorpioides]|uniref:Uncharacterized protein n=1 Tax=Cordylochernes scorpioides TaxID=51811 RepID=A0ABY6KYQ6_9ARAC|nr:hypothetical protein LAZ67_9002362 [Cordylochernes scorpioides]